MTAFRWIVSPYLSTFLFSLHVLVTIQYTNDWSPKKVATKGQDVTLPCSVTAFPIPNVAWKKDGELVTNDSRHVVTRTALKILQVSTADMGRYYCIAWNRGTVQAKNVLLLIKGAKLNSSAVIVFLTFTVRPKTVPVERKSKLTLNWLVTNEKEDKTVDKKTLIFLWIFISQTFHL